MAFDERRWKILEKNMEIEKMSSHDLSSSGKDTDDNQERIVTNRNTDEGQGRIVTDSVYVRFRQPDVFCETCKKEIISTPAEIEKHFDFSHASNSSCCYCHGKVFNYVVTTYKLDGTPERKEIPFHRCPAKDK